jgi:hypothetical protein
MSMVPPLHLVVDDPALFLRIVKIVDFSSVVSFSVGDERLVLHALDDARQSELSVAIPQSSFLLFERPSAAGDSQFAVKTDDLIDSLQACVVSLQGSSSTQSPSLGSIVDRSTVSLILWEAIGTLEIASQSCGFSIKSSLKLLEYKNTRLDPLPASSNRLHWMLSVASVLPLATFLCPLYV